MRLSESATEGVEFISTGSFSLDLALGIKGLPRGRIVEIYGSESAGKSTLSLSVVAEAQKRGGRAAYIDAEHALDPNYASVIGVNADDLYLSQPNSAEEGLDITEHLVRSGAFDVVVVDSVAALVPLVELEGEMGDQQVGLQARLMSKALRKLTGAIHKTQTVVIFINQIRSKIGVMFGNPETTPGGNALKFHSSVRIDLRRKEVIKKGPDSVGTRVRARVVKNKVAPPFRTAEFDILFNQGLSRESELLSVGLERGFIKRSGASYSFDDTKIGQGQDAARDFLKDNPDLAQKLESRILEEAR